MGTKNNQLLTRIREIAAGDNRSEDDLLTALINALPDPVKQYVNEANRCTSLNIEFFIGGALAALSTAMGYTHQVKAGPQVEAGSLYIAIVAPSGAGKTPAVKMAVQELIKREIVFSQRRKQQAQEWKEYNKLSKEQKDKTPEPPEPTNECIVLHDHTVESLPGVFNDSKRGVLNMPDELTSLTGNFNKYNSGSADAEFYIKVADNEYYSKTLKSGGRVDIAKPYLVIVGGVQDSILKTFAAKGRESNGFLFRFLVIYPDTEAPRKFVTDNINHEVERNYKNLLARLFELPLNIDERGNVAPVTLPLSNEAGRVYGEWMESIDSKRRAEAISYVKSIYSKSQKYVLRLALILQVCEYVIHGGSCTEVSANSVTRAIAMMEYFIAKAIKMHGKIHDKGDEQEWKWTDKQKLDFYIQTPDRFDIRDPHIKSIIKAVGIKPDTLNKFLSRTEIFINPDSGIYQKVKPAA